MRKLKPLYMLVGLCLVTFIFVIAYWTILPRTTTLDIPGEGIYTGQLRGMTFHGYGTYKSHKLGGTTYEGEWENGRYHGKGTLTFANGSQVIGQFKGGSFYGQGVAICPDGYERTIDFGEQIITGGSCSCCGNGH